jgi:hypothetical protein
MGEVLKRAKQRATQWCLWLARKCCEIIVVVLDTVEAIVDTAKDVAKAAVRAAAEIVQRVVESEVFQNIRAGVRTVKDFTDVPETLHTTWLILLWLWSLAMSLACSSYVAAPWAAASTAFCAIGLIYFAMFTTSIIFALFLIGRLARPARN